MTKVSIIMALFNKSELTKNCLESVYKHTNKKQFELILIDNGSTDNTLEVVNEFMSKYKNIYLIQNEKNVGYAIANNQGVKRANTEYILLLNNDTVVTKGWLNELLKVITQNEYIAGVGSQLLFENGLIQHAGVITIYNERTNVLIATHKYYNNDSKSERVNIQNDFQVLTAACLLLRRDLFNRVDGFDERYYNGNEDVDLCFKIGELGYKFTYVPTSKVYHFEHSSGDERFVKSKENVELMQEKWLGKIQPDYVIQKDKSVLELITTSIVIPCFNNLKYTKECIESIYKHTDKRFKLIIIDNNSRDGTKEYLAELKTNNNNVTIITNTENLGYTKAVNQGMKLATGNVVLLNNDIIVAKNWLGGLLRHLNGSDNVGIVSGMTNYASGVQMLHGTTYNDYSGMLQFANELSVKNKNKHFDFPRVIFMCVLISRNVINTVGYLDEIFSPGNFEDDDYCRRSQLSGFKTRIALDVFTHHFGSKSFKANDGYNELLKTNEAKFISKWGGNPNQIWNKELTEFINNNRG